MTIGFVAVGDEVLRGETREANGRAFALALAGHSLDVSEIRVVSDRADAIAEALVELSSRSRLLLLSGGLGPTDDDGTRQAVADAFGRSLRQDEAIIAELQQRYGRAGRVMDAINLRQAQIPESAHVLANDHGTAPGFSLLENDCVIACLPGVPREFERMLDDHLADLLRSAGITAKRRHERELRIFGITESALAERLSSLPDHGGVKVRSLPRFPEIALRISAAEDAVLTRFVEQARGSLGWRIYSDRPGESHPAAVVRTLQTLPATLAIAESCTGGLLGDLLTDVPGVSQTLIADLVCYANEAKTDLLGVDPDVIKAHGAVSEETVIAMAEAARQATGADFSVSTSGIAGPGGGSEDRPVGTIWMAVSSAQGTEAWRGFFPGLDRRRFKLLVAHGALARLRTAALDAAASRTQSDSRDSSSSR